MESWVTVQSAFQGVPSVHVCGLLLSLENNISGKWFTCQLLWWILLEYPSILNGFIQAASLSAIVIYVFGVFCVLDTDKDTCFSSPLSLPKDVTCGFSSIFFSPVDLSSSCLFRLEWSRILHSGFCPRGKAVNERFFCHQPKNTFFPGKYLWW